MKKNTPFLLLLLLCMSGFAYSQTGQWTWMSGDSTAVESPPDNLSLTSYDVYGTKGVPSVNNKPPAREDATTWTDKEGNLWMYGGHIKVAGFFVEGYYGDLWKYNPATNEWTWVYGPAGYSVGTSVGRKGAKGEASVNYGPGRRRAAVSWIDNDGNLWMMGGYGRERYYALYNDLWKFNPSTLEWAWMGGDLVYGGGDPRNLTYITPVYGTKGVSSPNNFPAGEGYSFPFYKDLTWTDAEGKFWLLNKVLWRYDPATTEWTWMSGDLATIATPVYGTKGVPSVNNWPGNRGATTWTDKSGMLWLFGGNDKNHLWKYNPATNEWTWVSGEMGTNVPPVYGTKGVDDAGNHPGSMNVAAGWTGKNGVLWLFGDGDDLWRYNPVTNRWAWMRGDDNNYGVYGTKGVMATNNEPGARTRMSTWTDKDGNLWLFGGEGYANSNVGHLKDLWRYSIFYSTPGFFNVSRMGSFCAGSQITVSFTGYGAFNIDNVFTASLVSRNTSTGVTTKIAIGTLATTSVHAMQATIPANLPPGPYTILVESSSPAVGTGLAGVLIVRPLPSATITASDSYTSPGLTYKYYEGSWTSLPDFGGLKPVATGTSANVSLAPRKRDDNFAFLWEGQITVPAAGTYYLETDSDDGSRLYIGEYSHYATPVVNNDGLHAHRRTGGSYWFPAAGTYPIAITYFEATGAESMKLYWTSPEAGIPNRTLIPDAAFTHLTYSPTSAGLTYKYYEGSWTKLPDFGGLTPVATGTVGGVDLSPRKRDEQFAFLWEGKIFIPKGGTYQFETRSDDGSRLYVGNYGHYVTPVVDNDGLHPMQSATGSYTFPQAGMYPIAITYFEATGGEGIELFWSSADAGIPTRTRIPNNAFREVLGIGGCSAAGVTLTASEGDSYLWSTGETTRSIVARQNGSYTVTVTKGGCSATSAPMVVSCIDNSLTQNSRVTRGAVAQQVVPTKGQLRVKALPNPSPSHFTLQVSNAQPEKRITLHVLDGLGRLVETKIIAAGTPVQVGSTYRPGTYFAHVVQGSDKVTVKLVKTAGF